MFTRIYGWLLGLFIVSTVLVLPVQGRDYECSWISFSAARTRFPVQVDNHATYLIMPVRYSILGPVRLEIKGQYPYMSYSRFSVYDEDGVLYSTLTDYEINPDSGSINPYQEGNLVLASNRNFTIDAVMDAYAAPSGNRLPIPDYGEGAYIVFRLYEQIDGAPVAGEPVVKSINASTGDGMRCRQLVLPDFLDSDVDLLNFPDVDPDGNVSFLRYPPNAPFSNGNIAYLIATIDDDESKVTVIQIPDPPQTFDTNSVTSSTCFSSQDTRYVSLGSYGSSLVSDNSVAGDEMLLINGSAYIIIGDESLRSWVEGAGLNFLPISPSGLVSPINPYLIYRSSIPSVGYDGDLALVGLFDGPLSEAPPSFYAENFIYGRAPRGKQCSMQDFQTDACGYADVANQLNL